MNRDRFWQWLTRETNSLTKAVGVGVKIRQLVGVGVGGCIDPLE